MALRSMAINHLGATDIVNHTHQGANRLNKIDKEEVIMNGKKLKALMRSLIAMMAFLNTMQSHADAVDDTNNQVTALKCGTLLDVDHRAILKGITILVQGDRINAIEKNDRIPEGVRVIDLSDKVCLPGLMDMHVHAMASDPRGKVEHTDSSAKFTLRALSNVQGMLNLGFTTIRIPGDMSESFGDIDLRNTINDGLITGPRMLVAPHRAVAQSLYVPWMPEEPQNLQIRSGVDAARDFVRNQVRHNADWIKVAGDYQFHPDEIQVIFTDEEIKAFAEEAHALRKPITIHSHGNHVANVAARYGYDSVEHGFFIKPETARLMKKQGTWLVPTLTVFDMLYDEYSIAFRERDSPGFRDMAEGLAAERKEARAIRDQAFKYAYDLGVKIAFGTDLGTPELVTREFSYLARLGVSNWDAIAMATINGAELLGMKDQLGSISTGKFADIIALSKNPLDDITAIDTVQFVMRSGEIVRHD